MSTCQPLLPQLLCDPRDPRDPISNLHLRSNIYLHMYEQDDIQISKNHDFLIRIVTILVCKFFLLASSLSLIVSAPSLFPRESLYLTHLSLLVLKSTSLGKEASSHLLRLCSDEALTVNDWR